MKNIKLPYSVLIILSFLFFEPAPRQAEEKPNNSFISDIQFFEKEKKTVSLITSKTHFFTLKSKKYKFEKDRYFEIVPPEYKIRKDTIVTYDKSFDKKNRLFLYEVVSETIQVKKGGWKWVENKVLLNQCSKGIEWVTKSNKSISYIKEPDEYITIKKLVLGNIHGLHAMLENNPEEYKKRIAIAKATIEDGQITDVINYPECIKDGYLREVSKEEATQFSFQKKEIIKFSKGSWNLIKPHLPEVDCPPTLQNIQLVLKNRGFDTNIDGKETHQYKIAKAYFQAEQKLKRRDEEGFLKALGFNPN